ncbi:MAG: helix-turn-helix transcriptional regulator [Patescibacteria group bacterium]
MSLTKERKFYKDNNLALYVGHMVRITRAKRKMAQNELAHRLGVQREYIVRIEKGQALPSIKLLQKAAKVFGKELHPPKLIY